MSSTKTGGERESYHVTTGTTTVVSVTVNTQPQGGKFSLHDCASIDQAAIHNMVWPINMALSGPATLTPKCKVGIVVNTQIKGSGNFTVVTS